MKEKKETLINSIIDKNVQTIEEIHRLVDCRFQGPWSREVTPAGKRARYDSCAVEHALKLIEGLIGNVERNHFIQEVISLRMAAAAPMAPHWPLNYIGRIVELESFPKFLKRELAAFYKLEKVALPKNLDK